MNGNSQINGALTVSSLWVYSGLTVAQGYLQNNGPPYVVTSDRRLKRDIVPVEGAVNKISKLRGVYFDWAYHKRNGVEMDDRRHIGLIAQDVQEVVPEAVNSVQDGSYLGVDYGSLVSLLIAAFNEVQQQQPVADVNFHEVDALDSDDKRCINKFVSELASIDDMISKLSKEYNALREESDNMTEIVQNLTIVNNGIVKQNRAIVDSISKHLDKS